MGEHVADPGEARATAAQEERHVGPQGAGDLLDARIVFGHAPQARNAHERRHRVGRPPAEAGLRGNALLHVHGHRLVDVSLERLRELANGLRDDVVLRGHVKRRNASARTAREVDGKAGLARGSKAQVQHVVQQERVHDAHGFVIPIRSHLADVEEQVHLRGRDDAHRTRPAEPLRLHLLCDARHIEQIDGAGVTDTRAFASGQRTRCGRRARCGRCRGRHRCRRGRRCSRRRARRRRRSRLGYDGNAGAAAFIRHVFRLLLLRLLRTFAREEVAQHTRALVSKHAGDRFERVVEPLVLVHRVQRAERAGFRIRRAVHAPANARLVHEARAHDARLQRHVHGAVGQPPRVQHFGGALHRKELRMSRRILRCLAQVACPCDDLRLLQRTPRGRIDGLVYDDGADGNLAEPFGAARLVDGHAHVVFVGHAAYYMVSYLCVRECRAKKHEASRPMGNVRAAASRLRKADVVCRRRCCARSASFADDATRRCRRLSRFPEPSDAEAWPSG